MHEKWATGSPHPSLLVMLATVARRNAGVWRPLTCGCGFQNAREWQGERMPHGGVAPYGFAAAMVVIESLKVKAKWAGA